MSSLPTRPADVPAGMLEHAADQLVTDAYNVPDGIRLEWPAAEVAEQALASLARIQALTDQLAAARWSLAGAALRFGASTHQIAEAAGLTRDDLVDALREWLLSDPQDTGVCLWCGVEGPHTVDDEPCPAHLPPRAVPAAAECTPATAGAAAR